MTEWIFFGVALVVIGVILGTGLVRRVSSAKLSPPMLFALRIFLGIVFTILGIIGSLLPILQGWIFFLLAFLVLFPKSRLAVVALDKAEPKMPRLVARLRRWGIGCEDEAARAR